MSANSEPSDEPPKIYEGDGSEEAAAKPVTESGDSAIGDEISADNVPDQPQKIVLEDEDEKRTKDASLSPEEKQEKLNEAKQLRQEGNDHFRNGRFEEASNVYQRAVKACPGDESSELAILYSNLAAALSQLSRHDDAVTCLNRAVVHDPIYVKAYLRRAKAYEQLDKLDEALEDYKKVVELDPSATDARRACMELPQRINERNEKMKAEMIDKLKQLGNLVLRPFGLSTDNFELKQDPSSGSYSVNMKK